MPIIAFAFVLIAVGVLLYVINRYVPMDGKIKNILNAAVIAAVVLWVLTLFGVFEVLSGVRIGKP